MHKNSNEGRIAIYNERCEILQNKSDEVSTSIIQDFEEVGEMDINNNSAKNDGNSDNFFMNNSLQESQCSRKSVVTASQNTSGSEKKVKKFKFKKGVRVNMFQDNFQNRR